MKTFLGIVFALLIFAVGLNLEVTSAEAETVKYGEIEYGPPGTQAEVNTPESHYIENTGRVPKHETTKRRPGEGCNKKYTLIGYSMSERYS